MLYASVLSPIGKGKFEIWPLLTLPYLSWIFIHSPKPLVGRKCMMLQYSILFLQMHG